MEGHAPSCPKCLGADDADALQYIVKICLLAPKPFR